MVEATFYRQATDAVAYWRCELPARYLPGKVIPSVEMTARKLDNGRVEFVDHEGACILQFPGSQGEARALMVMQAEGIPFLVEVDDNYLDASDPLWRSRSKWGARIQDEHPHSNQGHRWIVEHADGVIVTTPVLADAYGQHNRNVHICRNSIDPDDWPELVKPDDGVFRIGWYASLSHDRDAPLVRRALSWASRQPNVEVVTVGLDPAGWDFAHVNVPWEHHVVLRASLMRLDVGVAPIVRSSMSSARSDLKVLEYLMAGALPVVSGEAPYEGWRDVPFCLMAWTAADFEERIRWCVRNRDEVRALAREGREFVLAERTFGTEIGAWRTAIRSCRPVEAVAA